MQVLEVNTNEKQIVIENRSIEEDFFDFVITTIDLDYQLAKHHRLSKICFPTSL